MQLIRDEQRASHRPPVVYNTPGLECQHADRGACPSCVSPFLSHTRSPLRHSVTKLTSRGRSAIASRLLSNLAR